MQDSNTTASDGAARARIIASGHPTYNPSVTLATDRGDIATIPIVPVKLWTGT